MKLIADLHIHSPYSRATSSRLGLPFLDRWASIKGIGLIGTGDCTHPAWLEKLRGCLDDAEEGFFSLKKEVRDVFNSGPAMIEGLPAVPGPFPRFVLSGEIATIYKKGDKTRKIHHLVILPDFRAAAAFNAGLEALGGNIRSDGRPILGMDSRDLLALLLDTDERALLIPAHIWTPWFSALGEKSGFDSIEECYRDLTGHIPAIETGLSSNPPMNWALSSLDNFSIISNSDAHSPDKLGREATVLEMELSYSSLHSALFSHSRKSPALGKSHPAITGTIEFFPQEGKYHYDGHRKCGVSLAPEKAASLNYLCPVCGKALTRGVMGRVLELADRPVNEEESCPPDYWHSNRRPYYSLIPLREIIAELSGTGAASKKTEAAYFRLIEKGGSEFSILMEMSREDLEKLKTPELSAEILAGAIMKMRTGEVFAKAGYDGEYGKVRIFASARNMDGTQGEDLFGKIQDAPREESLKENRSFKISSPSVPVSPANSAPAKGEKPFILDSDQERAVSYNGKRAVIIAGPGTGKTAVLGARIARLTGDGADPCSILALTFTVKAAAELKERIRSLCGRVSEGSVTAATFHSFCCSVLRDRGAAAGLSQEFKILPEDERDSLLKKIAGRQAKRLGSYIEERKRQLLLPGEEFPGTDIEMEALYAEYREALLKTQTLDFEDLSAGAVRLLRSHPEILEHYRRRFRYIFVDEYQDINFPQYCLVRLLVPSGDENSSLWVIGDPNQAIYGFRGSDKRFIDRFLEDYPDAGRFELSRSFRCAGPIINAAGFLTGSRLRGRSVESLNVLQEEGRGRPEVDLYRAKYTSEKSEAEGIARIIEALIGGTSFFAMDSAGDPASLGSNGSFVPKGSLAPSDCAVLVRAAALAAPVIKALKDHGIPFEFTGEVPWWKQEPAAALIGILREQRKILPESGVKPSPGDLIRAAWEGLAKGKPGQGKPGQKRPEAVEKLIGLAAFFDDVSPFLDTLDSCAASGIPEIRPMDGVKIMTIHASKGLEFEQVFVPGLEEGILPFTLFDEPGERHSDRVEEEKRLLYVAMTRAKKGLWLSFSESRVFRGRKLKGRPSRFLSELEEIIPLAQGSKPRKWDGQLSLF